MLNKTNQKIFIGSAIGAGAIILLHLLKDSGKTVKIDASTGTLGTPTGIGILLLFAIITLGMEYGFLKMVESENAAIHIFGIVLLITMVLPAFLVGAGLLLFFFN